MKTSPFQIILIAAFGLAALIGLFVFATYSANNSGSTGVGPVVIWGTLPKTDITAAITAAAQIETDLKDASYVQKEAATLTTELATAIATGNSPDLVLASHEELQALSPFISVIPYATISARSFADTFVEGGGLFAAPDGYYGIPLFVDPLVLYVNRSILSSSGIPKPPGTWEALAGLVSRVAVLTPERQVLRGLIALGTYDNVHNARGILSTIFLQTDVPISRYSEGGLTADLGTSGNAAPGKAVLGFYTQFADPAKISYTWNASLPDSQKAFLAGDLAMYLGYAGEARYLRSANPNLNFDIAPVPQPGTARAKNVYGLVYALMLPNGSKNPNGAFQAAALISNSASEAFAQATGLAPATLSALAAPSEDPIAALAYSQALFAKGWLSPLPAITDSVFSGMINSVMSGRATPDTALSSAEATLGSLLQQ